MEEEDWLRFGSDWGPGTSDDSFINDLNIPLRDSPPPVQYVTDMQPHTSAMATMDLGFDDGFNNVYDELENNTYQVQMTAVTTQQSTSYAEMQPIQATSSHNYQEPVQQMYVEAHGTQETSYYQYEQVPVTQPPQQIHQMQPQTSGHMQQMMTSSDYMQVEPSTSQIVDPVVLPQQSNTPQPAKPKSNRSSQQNRSSAQRKGKAAAAATSNQAPRQQPKNPDNSQQTVCLSQEETQLMSQIMRELQEIATQLAATEDEDIKSNLVQKRKELEETQQRILLSQLMKQNASLAAQISAPAMQQQAPVVQQPPPPRPRPAPPARPPVPKNNGPAQLKVLQRQGSGTTLAPKRSQPKKPPQQPVEPQPKTIQVIQQPDGSLVCVETGQVLRASIEPMTKQPPATITPPPEAVAGHTDGPPLLHPETEAAHASTSAITMLSSTANDGYCEVKPVTTTHIQQQPQQNVQITTAPLQRRPMQKQQPPQQQQQQQQQPTVVYVQTGQGQAAVVTQHQYIQQPPPQPLHHQQPAPTQIVTNQVINSRNSISTETMKIVAGQLISQNPGVEPTVKDVVRVASGQQTGRYTLPAQNNRRQQPLILTSTGAQPQVVVGKVMTHLPPGINLGSLPPGTHQVVIVDQPPPPAPPPPPPKPVITKMPAAECEKRLAERQETRATRLRSFFDDMTERIGQPESERPFSSLKDVVERLLPYGLSDEPPLKPEYEAEFDNNLMRSFLNLSMKQDNLMKRVGRAFLQESQRECNMQEKNLLLYLDHEYERRKFEAEKALTKEENGHERLIESSTLIPALREAGISDPKAVARGRGGPAPQRPSVFSQAQAYEYYDFDDVPSTAPRPPPSPSPPPFERMPSPSPSLSSMLSSPSSSVRFSSRRSSISPEKAVKEIRREPPPRLPVVRVPPPMPKVLAQKQEKVPKEEPPTPKLDRLEKPVPAVKPKMAEKAVKVEKAIKVEAASTPRSPSVAKPAPVLRVEKAEESNIKTIRSPRASYPQPLKMRAKAHDRKEREEDKVEVAPPTILKKTTAWEQTKAQQALALQETIRAASMPIKKPVPKPTPPPPEPVVSPLKIQPRVCRTESNLEEEASDDDRGSVSPELGEAPPPAVIAPKPMLVPPKPKIVPIRLPPPRPNRIRVKDEAKAEKSGATPEPARIPPTPAVKEEKPAEEPPKVQQPVPIKLKLKLGNMVEEVVIAKPPGPRYTAAFVHELRRKQKLEKKEKKKKKKEKRERERLEKEKAARVVEDYGKDQNQPPLLNGTHSWNGKHHYDDEPCCSKSLSPELPAANTSGTLVFKINPKSLKMHAVSPSSRSNSPAVSSRPSSRSNSSLKIRTSLGNSRGASPAIPLLKIQRDSPSEPAVPKLRISLKLPRPEVKEELKPVEPERLKRPEPPTNGHVVEPTPPKLPRLKLSLGALKLPAPEPVVPVPEPVVAKQIPAPIITPPKKVQPIKLAAKLPPARVAQPVKQQPPPPPIQRASDCGRAPFTRPSPPPVQRTAPKTPVKLDEPVSVNPLVALRNASRQVTAQQIFGNPGRPHFKSTGPRPKPATARRPSSPKAPAPVPRLPAARPPQQPVVRTPVVAPRAPAQPQGDVAFSDDDEDDAADTTTAPAEDHLEDMLATWGLTSNVPMQQNSMKNANGYM
ncbi:unnamed protein product, partial [Mesorhabditis spiculigera]